MDREYLLTALSLLAALLPPLAGWFVSPTVTTTGSARDLERAAWRRLWLPLLPTGLWFAFLAGWALREPDDAEGLPIDARALTALAALLLARSVWRAWRVARQDAAPTVGVVGLLFPRVTVDAAVEAALSPRLLAAALAHEAAHRRHRDPLRIWIAGLLTDLQLGSRPARARLAGWRHALELARDEEAREGGVAGADLAAAIVAVTRIERGFPAATAALLEGDGVRLRERVERLLTPPVPTEDAASGRSRLVAGLLAGALLVGVFGGEALIGGALR